jgi:phosphoribosyl-ATP pyrophosphohydrolase/phosphoribosyl-AMP cyclohydrolase
MRIADLKFDSAGLIPAVIQAVDDKKVLMVAYMSLESLELSLATRQTHFFSRSRGELWHKGATSGNTQNIVSILSDCDGDLLLVLVEADGAACHTGERSCFDNYEPLEQK